MSNIIMGLFIIVMGLSFTSIGVIVVKRGLDESKTTWILDPNAETIEVIEASE